MSLHLLRPVGRAPPRTRPTVDCGLCVIVRYQRGLFDSLAQGLVVEGCAYVELGDVGNLCTFSILL